MATRTLHDLLIHELRELYDAEHGLVKLLAALSQEVRDPRTAQLLNTLRCETRNHVFGIEQVLSTLGHVPRRVKCRWLQGFAEGYNAFARTKPTAAVLDTFDLAMAVKLVRATISSYRILITLALRVKCPQIVDVLRQHVWDVESAAERLQAQLGRNENSGGDSYPTTVVEELPHSSSPAPFSSAQLAPQQVPPDSPEDRENVLAGGVDVG